MTTYSIDDITNKCLDIVNSVHHSDEQVPTFLETCISLDYPQVKGYFYKYFCNIKFF